jgi:hypothetical protein
MIGINTNCSRINGTEFEDVSETVLFSYFIKKIRRIGAYTDFIDKSFLFNHKRFYLYTKIMDIETRIQVKILKLDKRCDNTIKQ